MTHHEDPNLGPRTDYGNQYDRSTTAWISGGFVGLGLIVAAMFVFSDDNPRMAQDVERSKVTASVTTGSAPTTTGAGVITGKGTPGPASR